MWFNERMVTIKHVDQIAYDTNFEEHTIESVQDNGDYYDIGFDRATHTGIRKKDADKRGIVPKVGDTLRIYGKGFGMLIHGIAVNGVVIRYESEEEMKARIKYESEKHKRNTAVKAYQKIEQKLARVQKLPHTLRVRMEHFMKEDPNFILDSWFEYELFTLEEAALIADHFDTVEELNEWYELPYDQQEARVPVSKGHSGNTIGFAVSFARHLIQERAGV